MSYRLHVHKKHVIEYGADRFNWSNGEVNRILYYLCDSYHGNTDYFEADNEIEIPKEEFKAMLDTDINTIKHKIQDAELDLPEDYTVEEMMQCFKALYDDADPGSDYIHLSWI